MCNHACRIRGVRAQPPVELQTEYQVSQLRLLIGSAWIVTALPVQVVEVQLAALMRNRRHRHHAALRLPQECRQKQSGQRKVAQMVGAELHLEALWGRT